MQDEIKLKYLSVALYVFGTIFIVGVPAMMMVIWPSGWSWSPAQIAANNTPPVSAALANVPPT